MSDLLVYSMQTQGTNRHQWWIFHLRGLLVRKQDIPTYNLEGTISNYVPRVFIVVWSKALKQHTIHIGACSATQGWGEWRTTCSKPNPRPSCEGIARPTNRRSGHCPMSEVTLTAPPYYPGGEPSVGPVNSTCKRKGISRTCGRGRCELPSNTSWMGNS